MKEGKTEIKIEEKKENVKEKKENVNFFLNDSDLICWKDTRNDPYNKDHFMRKIKSSSSQFMSFDRVSFPQQKEESLKIDLIYK